MPKLFSTAVVLLSVLAGCLAPARLSAQTTTVNYANGTVSVSRTTTTANLLTGAAAAGIVATENGVISGDGSFTKTGAGSLTLNAANTYTGNTTISAGNLTLAGTTRSPSFAISSGASLNYLVDSGTRDASVATTTFTGAGTLIKSGAGNLVWGADSAVFAFSAGAKISVEAGTFVGGSNANENWAANYADLEIATGALFLGAEANVRVNALTGAGRITSGYDGAGYQNFTFGVGNGSGTFSGVLANDDGGFTGHYVKTGTGTQLLTGDNTYTGTTTINGGTLALSGATSSSAFVVGAGSVLEHQVDSGTRDASAATTTFTGTGTLLKSGAGTLGWFANSAVFALSSGAKINVQGGIFAGGGFANENWTDNYADLEVASGALFIGAEANVRVNALTGAGRITSGYNGAGYQNFTFGVSNGSGTFAGVLANDDAGFTGHYVKTGTGTQILTGANTYTGTTTISGGTLQVGDGGTTGSLASSTITNNAALVFNRSGSSSYAGVIEGTGTLTKLGDGNVTLSGTNTYTGNTTISAGTLTFASASDQTLSGILSGAGSLDKAGAGTLTLSGNNTGYTGATTISAGTLVLGTSTALGTTGAIAIASGATLDYSSHGANLARFSGAGTLTGSGSFNYNSAADHSLATILAGAARLDKGGAGTLTLSGNHTYTGRTFVTDGTLNVTGTLGNGNYAGIITTVGSLIFSSASDQILSGQLIWSGSLTQNGTGTLTLSANNGYTGATTINSGSLLITGSLGNSNNYAGNIANAANLTFTSGHNQTLSGILSGAGTLTQSGIGTLTLSGANTYTGNMNVASGAIYVSGTLGSGDYAGNIANANDLIFASASNQTLSGVLSGSGMLNKLGSGTLTLSGTSTYAGTTTVHAGSLVISGTPGPGNIATASATALTFASDSHQTVTGSLYGAGTLTKSGTGTLTLSGANTYTGNTTIASGTLAIAGTLGSSNIANAGTLAFISDSNQTLSGILSGSGSLTKSGTGTLTLTGDNTSYTGATTIASGTLALGGATALGNNGGVTIASGATLDSSTYGADLNHLFGTGTLTGSGTYSFNSNTDTARATVLAGSASLIKYGNSSLTLSGANTYTGTTTISGGELTLGANNVLADTTAVTIQSNAFLELDGFSDTIGSLAGAGYVNLRAGTLTVGGDNTSTTFSGVVRTGTGTLHKSGTGTLTLSGRNSYTGATTISGGTLVLQNGTDSASFAIASGAVLDLNAASGNLEFTNLTTYTGAGTLRKTGAGSVLWGPTGTFALATGSLIDVQAGTFVGSSNGNENWTNNLSDLHVASGATFNGSGGNIRVDALSGAGTVNIGNASFTLGVDGGSGTFSGTIIEDGTGMLIKAGTGTQTLSGTNTFSGGTTINGGLVNFSSLANFGPGSVTMNGGGLQWASGTSTDASAQLAALGTNGATFDTNGNDVTFASALSGSGALTKTGAGTLTLSGANTYTGGTTVAGGLVNFSSLGNFGTGNVALNGGGLQWGLYNYTDVSSRLAPFGPNGATFDTNGKDISFASALSGSGGLTKSGDGRLRLSVANSYTGTTTINGGSILLLGTATLGSGATILNGTGSLYLSGTTANAGNGNFTLNGDAPDIGTGTRITFAAANVSGTFTVNGGTIDTAGSGTLEFLTGTAGTAKITNNAAMGSGYGGRTLFSDSSRAADSTITNNGSTVAGAQAGGTEFHGTAIAERATLIANGGSNGGTGGFISFSANSNGSASTVKVYGNGTLDISLHNPGFVSVGSLEGTGQVNLGSNNLYVGYQNGNVINNVSTVFSGIIQGAGGSLTKFGTGTFTLSGENTYSGGTTIYGGMVNFARLANFGTGTVTVMSGGLQWAPGNTSDISSRLSAIGSGGATFDTNGNNVTFASGLSGSGRVTKAGTGTLTLSGNNTYTGGTTITGGIVNFSSLGSGTVTLNGGGLQWASGSSTAITVSLGAGGGTFDTNGNDVTLTGVLGGSGGITKSGAGTLTFSAGGNYSYTGNTTINSGTLRFDGPLNSYAGNIANAGTLVVNHPSGGFILSGVISGSGNLVSSAYLTLAGVNTYTGNTVSSVGSLKVTGTLGAGNYAGDIAVSSLLALSSSADQLLSGVISGTAQLTKNGSGTLTLTGANIYSGVTFIDAGTLVLSGGDNRLPTGKFVTISNGATLDLGGYSQELNLPSVTALSLRVNSGTVTAGTIKSNGTVSITAGTLANTWEGTGLLRIGGDANATVYLNGTNNSERVGTTSQLYIGDASTAGIVKIGNANALLAASQDALIYRGTLDLNGQTEVRGHGLIFMNGSTASLVNGSTDHAASFLNSISLTTGLANIGGAGQLTLGPISGNGGFTKIGTGTLTLSGANTYAGGTTVNAGTLAAGSTTAFGSSTVRVDAGALNLGGFAVTNALDVRGGTLTGLANYAGTQTVSAAMNYAGSVGGSLVVAASGALNTTGATFAGATTVNSGGRLSGTGSLASLTLNTGATLTPGNSPGTLTVTGNATWNGGANYAWEINDATGVAGTNYDLVSISGSLTLAATAGNKFTLSLLSLLTSNNAGDVINFNAAQNSSYTIASATGGIFGFDANAFTINTSGFSNALAGGTWSLALANSNRDLNLNFTAASAIPEPGTYAMLIGGAALALAIYRRHHRNRPPRAFPEKR